MKMEIAQQVQQSIQLSVEQRITFKNYIFDLRLRLIENIRGFTERPTDFTTCCPNCEERFDPKLICFSNEARIEVPFFCAVQTLDQLRGRDELSPEDLMAMHPGVYRSALVHFGTLKRAFARIEVSYAFEERINWETKVEPFLGNLPDTVIAACAGVSVRRIQQLRRKRSIAPYEIREAIKDSGVLEETN